MRKFLLRGIAFTAVLMLLLAGANHVLLPKDRSYVISQELKKEKSDTLDVMVFGSCHAYNSFNPIQLYKDYGVTSYNFSKPDELIPTGYLSMLEALESQSPKVVLVETWGINMYDTYISTEDIVQNQFISLVDSHKNSMAKFEVINDFDILDISNVFVFSRYKTRLQDHSINKCDFFYSLDNYMQSVSEDEGLVWIKEEMTSRIANKGFRADKPKLDEHRDYEGVKISQRTDEKISVPEDIMKYIDKIIKLCEEKQIELIF